MRLANWRSGWTTGRFCCLLFRLLCLSTAVFLLPPFGPTSTSPYISTSPLLSALFSISFSWCAVGVYTSGFYHVAVSLVSHGSLPPVSLLLFLFSFPFSVSILRRSSVWFSQRHFFSLALSSLALWPVGPL